MKDFKNILYFMALTIALTACQQTPAADTLEISANTPRQGNTTTVSQKPVATVDYSVVKGTTGTDAYNWGYNDATQLLKANNTTTEIRDQLLELRARHYYIQSNSGRKAADDYMMGIQDYLRQQSDTLYTTLFTQI